MSDSQKKSYYAILVVDGRSTLFGPFDTDDQRDQSVSFHQFDHPAATALRLDVHDGVVSLKEHQPFCIVPQHHPDIVLFKPEE